jgi:hypothetical protein
MDNDGDCRVHRVVVDLVRHCTTRCTYDQCVHDCQESLVRLIAS